MAILLVEQGAHEIGVRLALGTERRDILTLIVKRGMRLAIIGVAMAVAAAFGSARVLSKMLFGVGSTDLSTYVTVVATLGAIAFLACYLPALRATRLDPIIAMRKNRSGGLRRSTTTPTLQDVAKIQQSIRASQSTEFVQFRDCDGW